MLSLLPTVLTCFTLLVGILEVAFSVFAIDCWGRGGSMVHLSVRVEMLHRIADTPGSFCPGLPRPAAATECGGCSEGNAEASGPLY